MSILTFRFKKKKQFIFCKNHCVETVQLLYSNHEDGSIKPSDCHNHWLNMTCNCYTPLVISPGSAIGNYKSCNIPLLTPCTIPKLTPPPHVLYSIEKIQLRVSKDAITIAPALLINTAI